MTITKVIQCTFAAALSVAAGCSSSPEAPAPAASQGGEATPDESASHNNRAVLSDGQALKVLATVDTGEIAQAQVAVTKATSPQVRNFANEMIEAHNRAKEQSALLASQANITPASSELSVELQRKGSSMLEKLQAADASEFDATYMKGQIKQHQEVLDILDDQLIPSATSPDARNSLVTARGMVQHHVARAQQVYDTLTP